jgi:hypothetical protein
MTEHTNKYSELFVKRIGNTNDSYMITTDLIDIFPKQCTILFNNNTIKCTDTKNYIEIPKILYQETPNFIIVEGNFVLNTNDSNYVSKNNILGNNSIFYTKMNVIEIPIIKCTSELLQFFGCTIISNGDILKLNNHIEMPFFKIKIGKNYKNGFLIQQDLGEGFYIETHDTPHIHQPINNDAEGYLVLSNRQDNMLLLSKVRIPYGQAIYIPPNTYHNDSLLIGDYNVLYTKTNNYQTYIFTTLDNKIVNII